MDEIDGITTNAETIRYIINNITKLKLNNQIDIQLIKQK